MNTEEQVDRKKDFLDKVRAAKFTTNENLISLTVIVTTLFFHMVFTMAFHLLG